jgi:type III restriction enzyme
VVEVETKRTRTSTRWTSRCPADPPLQPRVQGPASSILRLRQRKLPLKPFTPEETREIVFKTMLDGEVHHTISSMAPASPTTARWWLLRPPVAEGPAPRRRLRPALPQGQGVHTGTSRIEDRIRLRETRPFRTENRDFLVSKKSIFSKIVGEPNSGGFELKFARFLDSAPDVRSFAKNYLAVGFKIDYVRADGDLSNYVPDFLVKTPDGTVWIIETKGRAELDLPQKMNRLRQWCADATAASEPLGGNQYRFVYVDQTGFERNPPATLAALVNAFSDYQT